MAAAQACDLINQRLAPIRSLLGAMTWKELVAKALSAGINLQAQVRFHLDETYFQTYNFYHMCSL